ncbi:hypothetical protein, variant [Verruconis gallopava]|uniref:Uncharacterized protein n=1 Tax=Verruconis gallopava TaxID=253628 RepID=A0A0D2A2H3_9PEZI|nr:uncharacterized protein PV09_07884 [Verruconis gallopava]XP_016210395.1 hypothetical protein, variant [Verruconis gallopava]KIW00525.1 hypothetical protein PV09_07884 [Verruconis gallopava]KIW00526.1 hypothetical protein, variant [Verruconis gallopava]
MTTQETFHTPQIVKLATIRRRPSLSPFQLINSSITLITKPKSQFFNKPSHPLKHNIRKNIMVAISKIVSGFAVLGATAFAQPVETAERRQLTCLLNPTVVDAVTCVLNALPQLSTNPTAITSCVTGLATDALNCVVGILGSIPGLPTLPPPL